MQAGRMHSAPHHQHVFDGPAQRWARTEGEPHLVNLEAEAAHGLPELQNIVRREGQRIRDAAPRRSRGFTSFTENWLLPCLGFAALVLSAMLLSPPAWFGDTLEYRYETGGRTEFSTLNYGNVDDRLVISLVCAALAGILLVVYLIMSATRGRWTYSTQGVGVFAVLAGAVNVMYLTVNVSDGFDALRPALWAHAVVLVIAVLIAVLAFSLAGRGRHSGAAEWFARLPPEHQRAIMIDRDAAARILADRNVIRQGRARWAARQKFGAVTARVNRQSEP